jgi:elongation factor 3
MRCCGNTDLDAFITTVVAALQKPATMPETVEALAGCVFVQEVEAPALAVLLPVLVRGLNHERTDVKRKCCVVIENMCKLVEHPKEVQPLMPGVLPQLTKLKDAISDPEARNMAEKAEAEVKKAAGAGDPSAMSDETVLKLAIAVCGEDKTGTVQYVAGLCAALARADCWEESEWATALTVLTGLLADADMKGALSTLMEKCKAAATPGEEAWEEIGEGEL